MTKFGSENSIPETPEGGSDPQITRVYHVIHNMVCSAESFNKANVRPGDLLVIKNTEGQQLIAKFVDMELPRCNDEGFDPA